MMEVTVGQYLQRGAMEVYPCFYTNFLFFDVENVPDL